MLFNKTKQLQRVKETESLNELGEVQGSIIMIVENLLNNVNYYTSTIEKLEKENKELRQFINELAQIVSGDREDLLVHMEAYLTSKNL
jgi:cell division GTPase FtsZ